MHTISYLSDYNTFHAQRSHNGFFTRLMGWIKNEEKNHIAWVGISITVMSAIFFPITMTVILFNGALISLIMGAMISLAAVVITNLAAMPTKYTLPALMLGILMDIVLMVLSFVMQ